jgi:hypothetical protein
MITPYIQYVLDDLPRLDLIPHQLNAPPAQLIERHGRLTLAAHVLEVQSNFERGVYPLVLLDGIGVDCVAGELVHLLVLGYEGCVEGEATYQLALA